MHKEKLARATHGGTAWQHDAARARGRRTRVRARVPTWSRRRPGTVLPARLHLEHAARQAAYEGMGQPWACCRPVSDPGMVEHSCGESGGGDGRLVAARMQLLDELPRADVARYTEVRHACAATLVVLTALLASEPYWMPGGASTGALCISH